MWLVVHVAPTWILWGDTPTPKPLSIGWFFWGEDTETAVILTDSGVCVCVCVCFFLLLLYVCVWGGEGGEVAELTIKMEPDWTKKNKSKSMITTYFSFRLFVFDYYYILSFVKK